MTKESVQPIISIPSKSEEVALIFSNREKLDSMIETIRTEVGKTVTDLTTQKGRDAIKSLAYKVTRTKTALDEAGAILTEKRRAEIKQVDAERKHARETLDEIRDQIKEPLVKWEEEQAKIKKELEDRLDALSVASAPGMSSDDIRARIAEVEAVEIEGNWSDMEERAAFIKDSTLTVLRRELDAQIKAEQDAAELAELRAKQEAAEKIIREQAAREKEQEAERQRVAAEAAAELAELRAEKKAREKELQDAKDAAERKLQEEIEAKRKADVEAEQAKKREEERRAEEKRKADAELLAAKQREADAKEAANRQAEAEARAEIEQQEALSEIARALQGLDGLTMVGKAKAIVEGKIPHVIFKLGANK